MISKIRDRKQKIEQHESHKILDEHMCSGNVSSFCYTSGRSRTHDAENERLSNKNYLHFQNTCVHPGFCGIRVAQSFVFCVVFS
jgi:hypothetical protein